MQTQLARAKSQSRQKPLGGYIQISTSTLGLLWWAYTEGLLSLRAVRVGLALFELRIRRDAHLWTEKRRGKEIQDFTPHYSTKELGDYCGLPEKRAATALTELQGLGLVTDFSAGRITFASSLEALGLTAEQRAEFQAWLGTLTRRKRVPIPRRILALACESSAPAQIAVILGMCLRCSWLRPAGEGFSYTGRIACSWLARHFGRSLRAIQKAKEHLVELGWIERQGNINLAGEAVAINPAWDRLMALPELEHETPQDPGGGGEGDFSTDSLPEPLPEGQAGTNAAGVQAPVGTNSAGVFIIESLPSEEIKDQRESRADERPENSGLGILISQKKPKETSPQDNTTSKPLPPPRLSAIRNEDFQDTGRALELLRQAVKCGLAPNDSEHTRLLWMAAIERARTVPADNPAGLFLFLVKHRKWDFLSDGHFEAANSRLKAYLYGGSRSEVPTLARARSLPERPVLSKDALLVQAVRNELAKRGLRCELFSVLRSQAGWDRRRFDAAMAELEGSRGGSQPLAAVG